jgi:two-component system LytT family sensor kinase
MGFNRLSCRFRRVSAEVQLFSRFFHSDRSEPDLQLAAQASLVVFVILAVCGLVDITHVSIENVFIGRGYLSERPLRYSFYNIVLFWTTYGALVPCVLFLTEKYRLDLQSWRRKLRIHTAAAITFAYIHTSFNAIFSPWRLKTHAPVLPSLVRTVTINFPIDFLAYWAIIGIAYALHFYSRSQQNDLRAAKLQATLAEARLRSLRAQLNPHFLFNTLNAISALALRGEGRAVARALSRLTDLLRIGLNEKYPKIITLANELELIDNYLEIQRLLFGDRLSIERVVDPEVISASVPCLILQPIVENAIVHGISQDSGIARIRIVASRDDANLRLQVVDSGAGFNSQPKDRSGIGLAGTQARLEHHFGAGQRLEYGRSLEGGACVTISIPFRTETAEARNRSVVHTS